jgi:hypothetical protein
MKVHGATETAKEKGDLGHSAEATTPSSPPALGAEPGRQANLGRFFDGHKLRFTASMIKLPGGRSYTDGDPRPDGKPGNLDVRVNGSKVGDPRAYILRDGDRIHIRSGS